MKNVAALVCLVGMLSLTACGGMGDDHPHDEDVGAHAHDGNVHSHEGSEAHAHGVPEQELPATEAFYGEQAGAAGDGESAAIEEAHAGDDESHTHGDEKSHTHDH
jgi:hypothetical protein